MANRYYLSGADGEIKPGKISAELREALNIAENDIPLWIYRMRALGYPPGWLKKAIVDTNDIFDTDSTNNDDANKAESSGGNRNPMKRKDPSNNEVQYDHSKLIEYPGFNMPMPKNCVDYHYYINMPAMLEHQQLEYAKKHMNFFKPSEHISKRARVEEGKDSISSANNNTSIPTIDLTNDSEPEDSTSKDDIQDGSFETPKEPKDKVVNDDTTKVSETLKKSVSSVSLPDQIKLVSKGSPMPKPVQRAPLEKFSEGVVGELLYFENLPASLGKFDSIRGLLNTIRRTKSNKDISFGSTKSDKN